MEAIETIDMADGTRVGGEARGLKPPTGPLPGMLFSEDGGEERGV